MTKAELLKLIQSELYKHDFNCFVDNPPSIAQGGKGVVVAGCPHCKKRLQSMNEFIEKGPPFSLRTKATDLPVIKKYEDFAMRCLNERFSRLPVQKV
jgi:hypothetical protein